tara:strand:+ start:1113 stop:1811 length:699 start_codon:yes stop_codon:yes gene_type:complete
MKILCVIGARGGSKGVKGKNIRTLLGKPLIAWTIEQAQNCSLIDHIVVSTDSQEIAQIARTYKAEVPFIRPKELASDKAGKWEVWQHALASCEKYYAESFDIYLDLDCTSPIRDVEDIYKAIEQFRNSSVDAVFSICESRKNPYFNMVEYDKDQILKVVIPNENPIVCRQNAPKVFDHVASIYVLDPNYLRSAKGLLEGNVKGFDIGVNKGIDLDNEFDFELIEYLMKKKYS